MVPKFTQNGFEVVKTPPEVAKLLKDAVEAGIYDWDNLPFEKDVEVWDPQIDAFLNTPSSDIGYLQPRENAPQIYIPEWHCQ